MTLQSSGQISMQDIIVEINNHHGTSISQNISLEGLIDGTYSDFDTQPDQDTPYFLSDFYGLAASG